MISIIISNCVYYVKTEREKELPQAKNLRQYILFKTAVQ